MRPGFGDGQPGLLDVVVFVVAREIHGLGRPRHRFVVSLAPNRAAQIINWDPGEERNARNARRAMIDRCDDVFQDECQSAAYLSGIFDRWRR